MLGGVTVARTTGVDEVGVAEETPVPEGAVVDCMTIISEEEEECPADDPPALVK